MKLHWRQWISEKIIDELVVGHITQERSRYPNRSQRAYGYIQNQEENLNLPPIEEAIAESYGPLCHKHGVKLYVTRSGSTMNLTIPPLVLPNSDRKFARG